MLTDPRSTLLYGDATIIVTADWATSEKDTSDFTAVGAFGLTGDGRLLVLEISNLHLRLEDCVPKGLLPMCQKWHPHVVGVESDNFQAAFANECRRYREIPEVRCLKAGKKKNAKLRRAIPAILMGENGRIYRPEPAPSWWEEYQSQLAGFTGLGEDRDDDVDVTAYAAMLAQELRGVYGDEMGPVVLTPGKSFF
jgi:phage terminase large subunit-like protein